MNQAVLVTQRSSFWILT